ncbi:glycosyltransferase family 2 protein [Pseudonocardia sp. RS010]|uniref:glycosyltransferase family 2 protein n=1 Tax=Pseudonocardia sp. RS010 TaxID=3385979 RepID=UPI0039A3318F
MSVVDIMLPFYGDPALLRRAVESVRAQRCTDWRMTVVDDGYPDPSIGPWFAGLGDERIRYRRNPARLGAQSNNRWCLEAVELEYFVMMGADDLMLPGYLDRVLALHDRYPSAAVVQPGVEVIDGEDRVVRTLADSVKRLLSPGRGVRELGGEALAASLLHGNWLYNPSLCWRSSALKTIAVPESTDVFDLALPLEVVSAGGTILVDDEVCFRYRRYRTSDSGSAAISGDRFAEEARFFRSAETAMVARGWPRAAKAARLHFSSRLNAACRLPGAVLRRDTAALRLLAGHLAG